MFMSRYLFIFVVIFIFNIDVYSEQLSWWEQEIILRELKTKEKKTVRNFSVKKEDVEKATSKKVKEKTKLVKEIKPRFNRLVIFDTTQNSWHGLVNPLPNGTDILRKSLASYYLCTPTQNCDERSRAKFAPRDDQKGDVQVIDTINKRSSESSYSDVYIVKDK